MSQNAKMAFNFLPDFSKSFFLLPTPTQFMPSVGLAKDLTTRVHAGFWMVYAGRPLLFSYSTTFKTAASPPTGESR